MFNVENVNTTELGRFEMDSIGQFRIVVTDSKGQEHISPHTWYRGIASLNVEGRDYIAVSAYFQGSLPIEQVLLVQTTTAEK